MNPRDIDWRHLRGVLLMPGLILLGSAITWGATTAYRASISAALATDQQTLGGLEAERDTLVERVEARGRYAQVYQQLALNGVVGPEPRLGWVQATIDAGIALRLPYLRYTTTPQSPFEASWLTPELTAPVLVSKMDLQLGLVHEGDLLRLADRLRESPGMPQVQSCSLTMLDAGVSPSADRANITGSCEVALYSIPRESPLVAANPEQ